MSSEYWWLWRWAHKPTLVISTKACPYAGEFPKGFKWTISQCISLHNFIISRCKGTSLYYILSMYLVRYQMFGVLKCPQTFYSVIFWNKKLSVPAFSPHANCQWGPALEQHEVWGLFFRGSPGKCLCAAVNDAEPEGPGISTEGWASPVSHRVSNATRAGWVCLGGSRHGFTLSLCNFSVIPSQNQHQSAALLSGQLQRPRFVSRKQLCTIS